MVWHSGCALVAVSKVTLLVCDEWPSWVAK